MELYEETNHGEVSEKLLREISGSLGWMRFISIVGILLLGIGFLGFVAAIFTALAYAPANSGDSSIFFLMIFAYFIMLAVYVYIYIVLLQAANEYSKFVKTRNMAHFERGIVLDKRFWQWLSITMIVIFALFLIFAMVISMMTMTAPSRFR